MVQVWKMLKWEARGLKEYILIIILIYKLPSWNSTFLNLFLYLYGSWYGLLAEIDWYKCGNVMFGLAKPQVNLSTF